MQTEPSSANLYSVTYVSSAAGVFSTSDLLTLMATSQRNNAASGVTGMLLHRSGNFMQVLEGPEQAVLRVHARIARDPRHVGLITLLKQPIATRQFGDWSMGFYDLSDAKAGRTPGYSEFMNVPLTGTEFAGNPSRAQKLLLTFKAKM